MTKLICAIKDMSTSYDIDRKTAIYKIWYEKRIKSEEVEKLLDNCTEENPIELKFEYIWNER